MTTLSLSARLDRTDSSTSWGFRMHGGKDFGAPLTIQKVNPGSLAQQCGLQAGDTIVKIGDSPTDGMMHREAQQHIMNCGNHLELALQRGGGRSSGTSHVPAPTTYAQPSQNSYAPSQSYNAAPSGYGQNASQSTLPVAVNKQYNTPINMYSVDNVMDTLATQTAGVNLGPSGSEEPSGATQPHKLARANESDSSDPGKHLHAGHSGIDTSKPIFRNASPVPFSTKPFTPARVSPVHFKAGSNASDASSEGSATSESAKPGFRSVKAPSSGTSVPAATTSIVPPTVSVEGTDSAPPPLPSTAPPSEQSSAPPKKPPSTRFDDVPSDRDTPKYKGYSNPSVQSRSFKALQHIIDSGEDVPSLQMGRKTSLTKPAAQTQPEPSSASDKYVKAIVNKQYNTPIGLYSGSNLKDTFETQASDLIDAYSGSDGETVQQEERKKIFIPSATLAAVQAQEGGQAVAHSAVTSGNFEKEVAPAGRKQIVVPSAKLEAMHTKPVKEPEQQGDDKKVYHPSETFRLVQKLDKGEEEEVKDKRMHSKAFARLQKNLDGGGSGAGAPHHVSAPAPHSSAPSSSGGRWQPNIPTGPRTMKVGKRGDARSMPAAGGGSRVPICGSCNVSIRGPFVSALDKTWCPNHFVCANPQCQQPLIDVGFVEEAGQLFCENDYRMYFAPRCGKCGDAIIGDRVATQVGHYHAQCFVCSHCGCVIAEGRYHTQGDKIYCTKDWGQLFQTKCYGCQFPIEPGDRWVEALNENWHSECFNCSTCQQNLEGQSFYAKGGKPYCKRHAGRF